MGVNVHADNNQQPQYNQQRGDRGDGRRNNGGGRGAYRNNAKYYYYSGDTDHYQYQCPYLLAHPEESN